MASSPEHTAKRDTAGQGIIYVNTRKHVRGCIDLMKVLDHPHEDAVSAAFHTKVKTIRENKAYDYKERHADDKVPCHREELPFVLEEHVHDRGKHEREPQKVRDDELRDERDHVIKRDIDYRYITYSSLREEEEHKV